MIGMIAAVAKGGGIGKDNQLLCHLSEDLKHFKALTMGKPMVMGRKTFESLPGILPGRPHWVLTREAELTGSREAVRIFHSSEEVLAALQKAGGGMIIGGAEIYRLFLGQADTLFITHIEECFEADAWFPEISPDTWEIVEEKQGTVDEKNPYAHRFVTYKRK